MDKKLRKFLNFSKMSFGNTVYIPGYQGIPLRQPGAPGQRGETAAERFKFRFKFKFKYTLARYSEPEGHL